VKSKYFDICDENTENTAYIINIADLSEEADADYILPKHIICVLHILWIQLQSM